MVTLARRAQRIPFAPVVAVLFGVAAAILVAAVPQWLFEKAVVASGLPTVLAAAAPPLGLVARLLAIALAFGSVAFLIWVLLAPVTRFFEAQARARTPWRDAGYDSENASSRIDPLPPRRPIFAPDELGAPLMSDEAIAPVVAFPESEPTLAEPVAVEELSPRIAAPANADSSISALIRRLEDGLARRADNDSDPDGTGTSVMALPSRWIMPDKVESPPAADGEDAVRQALGTLRRKAQG